MALTSSPPVEPEEEMSAYVEALNLVIGRPSKELTHIASVVPTIVAEIDNPLLAGVAQNELLRRVSYFLKAIGFGVCKSGVKSFPTPYLENELFCFRIPKSEEGYRCLPKIWANKGIFLVESEDADSYLVGFDFDDFDRIVLRDPSVRPDVQGYLEALVREKPVGIHATVRSKGEDLWEKINEERVPEFLSRIFVKEDIKGSFVGATTENGTGRVMIIIEMENEVTATRLEDCLKEFRGQRYGNLVYVPLEFFDYVCQGGQVFCMRQDISAELQGAIDDGAVPVVDKKRP